MKAIAYAIIVAALLIAAAILESNGKEAGGLQVVAWFFGLLTISARPRD